MIFRPVIASTLLLLGACSTLAPIDQRPAAPIPSAWPAGVAYAQPAVETSTASQVPWKTFVLDARMRTVIERALANSRDLRKTIATIESARATYRAQRADLFPTITAGVSGTRARSLTSTSGGGSTSAIGASYSATAGLSSYELDLFGKTRSLTKAALETYLAAEETGNATRISLIAETSSAWLTLAADSELLAISQRTQDSARRTVALTQNRLDAGAASMVDVSQAETVMQQARADVASYTTTIAQDRNALELLCGTALDDTLIPNRLPDDDLTVASVPAGLSSTVLLERPDVLSAEHQLRSANANIGSARAAFFPSLSLTSSAGVASAALSSLFTGGASIWTLAPSLSIPIFDGGLNRANLAYSEAQKQLYVATYELTVQTAFREVADALARSGTIGEQVDAQKALFKASSQGYEVADARYQQGVDTFLNALDLQRTAYAAEQTLVSTRLLALSNRVTLYRVLGGGLAGDGYSSPAISAASPGR